MRKLVLLLVFAGALATAPHRLQAQETSGRRQAASELLTVMNVDSMVLEATMTLLDVQLRSNPDMQHFRGVMESFMRETLSWDRIGPMLVDLYAETYTEALVSGYKSKNCNWLHVGSSGFCDFAAENACESWIF